MSDSIISASELCVSYRTHTVLDSATLAIQQGDRIGLVGRNGCGKSTIISAIKDSLEKLHKGTFSDDDSLLIAGSPFQLVFRDFEDSYKCRGYFDEKKHVFDAQIEAMSQSHGQAGEEYLRALDNLATATKEPFLILNARH